MFDHERFEELASLAALGELSPEEQEQFAAHQLKCEVCRAIVAETGSVAISAFLAGAPTGDISTAEGAGYHRAKKAIAGRVAQVVPVAVMRRQQRIFVAGIAATLLFGITLGAGAITWHGRVSAETKIAAISTATPSAPASLISKTPSVSVSARSSVQVQDDHWQSEVAALQHRLDQSQQESQTLREKLFAADERTGDLKTRLDAIGQQSAAQAQKLEQTQADLNAQRNDATQAREQLTSRDTTIDSLRFKLNDKESRLDEVTARLDREREMLSEGREVRDIMGARDLHIVDVVDVDEKGHNRKVFGRAFYTQGKSLIFYAFDLPSKGTKDGQFVYAAWGSNSAKVRNQEPQSLGIFYNDDQAQHRWAMKFEDRKVLEEIDTVFVTLEPAGHSFTAPTTKPILQAYFGTPPNHP